ncbi:MAG: hypothetical protein JNL63_00015 [Bacteroidia bacterium]|nr:hypothetical protein [Bacteroidia bacterium]
MSDRIRHIRFRFVAPNGVMAISFALILLTLEFSAQINLKDSSVVAPMICSSYSFQIPGADMAKRFGVNSAVGLQFLLKSKKNWIYGIGGDFMFGNTVNENGILDSIKTSDGFLIAVNGKLVDSRLLERGFSAGFKFGKLFPVFAPNRNSGIVAIAGIGFIQHKIRIELIDGTNEITPQLNDEMKKGYDRLTNGISLSQSLGYLHLSNNRITNFYAGIEITEGFTKNRRSFDYDLMKKDERLRTDLLYGIRIGWILPLYKRAPKEFYTN